MYINVHSSIIHSSQKVETIQLSIKTWMDKQNVRLPWWLSGKETACQMQETQVQSLIQEDPTCLRATKPIHHIYGAWVLQLLKPKHSRACVLQQEKPPQWEAATKSSPYLPQLEKAHTHNKKPAQPKINFKTIKKKRKKKIHLARQGMWVQSLPWLGN